MKKISVVIPAYNEEQMIAKAVEGISAPLREAGIDHELIFVNDGSRDRTWDFITEASATNAQVRGVSFSRNFGKESAIFAGLAEATGDCVAVIDCDLQHPPEKLVEMYRKWEEGYEVIEGVKTSRGRESAAHGFGARVFYKIISRAARVDMTNASDFKLLDRKAVEALLQMPEKNTFFRALSSWVGFKTWQVEYEVRERSAGETHWSRRALVKYAISNITSFTALPMQVVTGLGVLTFFIGIASSIEALVTWIKGEAVEGFTTVIILLCFSASIIMLSLGVIGYYIARIYEEIKGRPKYIISERTGSAVSEGN